MSLVRERILHARTNALSIRYAQTLDARLRTDRVLIWSQGDQALLLLLDTNLLSPDEAESLSNLLREWLTPLAARCPDLLHGYREGNSLVTDWLAQRRIEPERRFISAGLIQCAETEVSYTGAYSPIYLCTSGHIEQRVFDGPMWAASTTAGYSGAVGSVRLRPDQSLLVLSDGMLESRSLEGRISGDSVLYKAPIDDGSDILETVLAAYRSADAERIDNHGLLVIHPLANGTTCVSERTLMLFKPDVYELGLSDDILAGVGALGLRVVERFLVRFPPQGIFALWPRIYGRRWIENLQQTMPSRPLDVFTLEGDAAISRLIEFKDRLRADRAPVNSYRNLLHSPDSPAAVRREYAYLKSIVTDAR